MPGLSGMGRTRVDSVSDLEELPLDQNIENTPTESGLLIALVYWMTTMKSMASA